MKVCIGITTKNRAAILPKAIQSALDQNYANKEIVVFDDGSSDETPSLQSAFPQVRWMHAKESLGLLKARNALMESTDAELYVSLDDDAWFLKKDEVQIGVKAMEENPKLGVVAYDILQVGTKRFNPVDRVPAIPTNVFIGCGNMMRLHAVREAGDFVPFPVKYGHEEKDLSIRLIDLGYSLIFLPGVHVWHDYTPIERNLPEQRKSLIINDLIYQFRRVPLVYLVPVLVNNILRKLRSKDDDKQLSRSAIGQFFKLIPTQMSVVLRVSPNSYRRYRDLSISFLSYMTENSQKNEPTAQSSV